MEEVGDVELVGGGGGVGGDVAGPAEPLVALRAVGGDVEEVALLAPDGVGDELVDARVGAFEPAGPGHGGVHDDRFEVVCGELAGEAGDLGVPEAVEGEGGLEDVVAAGQDEGVGGCGGAQRPGAELVVLQDLGVPQHDLRRPGSPVARSRIQPTRFWPKSSRVLPAGEVQIVIGVRVSCRVVSGPTCSIRVVRSNSTVRRVSGARVRTAEPGVDGLTDVQAVGGDVGDAGGPGRVGDHGLGRAVGVVDDQLGEEADLGAVVGVRTFEAEIAAVPAVAEHAPPPAPGRVAADEQAGDVELLHLQPPFVGRPARIEDGVGDRPTVDAWPRRCRGRSPTAPPRRWSRRAGRVERRCRARRRPHGRGRR